MNEQCANTDTTRDGNGSTRWRVVCPVCGTLTRGRTLADALEIEYAHRAAGEALRTDTPTVRTGRITRDGIRFD